MRIVIVASFARSLLNFRGPLIEALVSMGFEVFTIAPNIPASIRDRLTDLGAIPVEVKLQRNGFNVASDLRYFFRMSRLLRSLKPDLVLTYTIKPNIWAGIAARINQIPSIAMVTGLGYAFTSTKDSFLSLVLMRFVTLLYRVATSGNKLVVFQNSDDRQDFLRMGCLGDERKARIVDGSGVDIEYFAKTPIPTKISFLMASRLLKNKGVAEYCEAALVVKNCYPDTRFFLAGDEDLGPDSISKNELKRWTDGGVEYLGRLEDIRPALEQASVYVLPSYREGTPRSVLEAMSMGRAIITTDAPGCRETTIDGLNGLLVPIQDIDTLANSMMKFVIDPQLCVAMGQISRKIAEEKYDVVKVNSVLVGFIEECLS